MKVAAVLIILPRLERRGTAEGRGPLLGGPVPLFQIRMPVEEFSSITICNFLTCLAALLVVFSHTLSPPTLYTQVTPLFLSTSYILPLTYYLCTKERPHPIVFVHQNGFMYHNSDASTHCSSGPTSKEPTFIRHSGPWTGAAEG